MATAKPTVLIGPVSDDPAESVSGVNRALMAGLRDEYRFVASSSSRHHGATAQSQLNGWNLYYLAKHTLTWIFNLARHRPRVAHYAINGGWALWKGLLFLRLARWSGARTVGHLHSGGFLDYWRTLPVAKRRKALAQFSRLDAFVVLSESWRTAMADEVGVSRAKLHVVNNPIDPEFERAALEMPIERAATAFLAMGIMSRDKGALDLVSACARVKQAGLPPSVCIAGPEREPGILDRMKGEIASHGLDSSIRLPGMVRGAAKLELFREYGISVLPSYYENFPLVLLEAAAAGHAIITTPVGAVPEFFTDGVSALFVEAGNPQQLGEAMIRLSQDPAERHRLAGQAREMFRRHLARPAIMAALHQVYVSVLGASGKELQLTTPDATT